MKDLSIIIPVYNIPTFMLEQCLESVSSIEGINYEVIIVNDLSPNVENRATINIYCNRRPNFRMVDLQQNGGVSHARNVGLSISSGLFVYFMDADDILIPAHFAKAFSNRSNVDLIIFHTECQFASNGAYIQGTGHPYSHLYPMTEQDLLYLLKHGFGGVCNKIMRRSIIGELRFPEKITNFEDLMFVWQYILLRNPRTLFYPEVCYRIRFREGSATRAVWDENRYLNIIRSACKAFDIISEIATSKRVAAKYLFNFLLSESLVNYVIIGRLKRNGSQDVSIETNRLVRRYLQLDSFFISDPMKHLLRFRLCWMKWLPSHYPRPIYYILKYCVNSNIYSCRVHLVC